MRRLFGKVRQELTDTKRSETGVLGEHEIRFIVESSLHAARSNIEYHGTLGYEFGKVRLALFYGKVMEVTFLCVVEDRHLDSCLDTDLLDDHRAVTCLAKSTRRHADDFLDLVLPDLFGKARQDLHDLAGHRRRDDPFGICTRCKSQVFSDGFDFFRFGLIAQFEDLQPQRQRSQVDDRK